MYKVCLTLGSTWTEFAWTELVFTEPHSGKHELLEEFGQVRFGPSYLCVLCLTAGCTWAMQVCKHLESDAVKLNASKSLLSVLLLLFNGNKIMIAVECSSLIHKNSDMHVRQWLRFALVSWVFHYFTEFYYKCFDTDRSLSDKLVWALQLHVEYVELLCKNELNLLKVKMWRPIAHLLLFHRLQLTIQ